MEIHKAIQMMRQDAALKRGEEHFAGRQPCEMVVAGCTEDYRQALGPRKGLKGADGPIGGVGVILRIRPRDGQITSYANAGRPEGEFGRN
jgi:hypothetical protein